MLPQSLLTGDNAAFLDQQYAFWLSDPDSVAPELRAWFEAEVGVQEGRSWADGPDFEPRSIFNGSGGGPGVAVAAVGLAEARQARVVQLINAYRVRGHMDANIDPLERRETVAHPELTLDYYGLTAEDLSLIHI